MASSRGESDGDDGVDDAFARIADALSFDDARGADAVHATAPGTPSLVLPEHPPRAPATSPVTRRRALLPVSRLESDAARRPRADGGGGVDGVDDEHDDFHALRKRFRDAFRATRPCVARVVARRWTTSSRLGVDGARGVFADADEPPCVVLRAKDEDSSTFLGRGGLCDREDGVLARDAFALVAARAAATRGRGRGAPSAPRRCYFRAPLTERIRADVDFSAAAAVFGGGDVDADDDDADDDDDDEAENARNAPTNPPPPPFRESTSSVWVSNHGCVTPTHFDLCHGLLTQLEGAKRALLVAPEHARSLYAGADVPVGAFYTLTCPHTTAMAW